MYIYRPNSVIIPREFPFERTIPNTTNFYESQKAKLDTKTVFYDIFFDNRTQQLRGIGPRLFNLKLEIFPLNLLVNGKKFEFQIYDIDQLGFLESEEIRLSVPDILSVTLQFKDFAQQIELDWKSDANELRNFDDIPLTISTLQKDNHIEWILDWILWHRRLYDVRRVVLYDNGSSNQSRLIRRLQKLKDEVQIIFVDWSFPYGVSPQK